MLEISDELAPKLLSPYLAMQSALASDALDTAKAHAKDMMKVAGHSGALPELLHNILAAATLEAFRKPYFETLSNAMIAAVKANPDAFAGGLYLMHCPMVYEDRGADWLQSDQKLMNPYYGSMMLHCGELKEAINSL
jgi:Cu(I)/Ag(I) efflux system membrane fusion protein